MGPIRTSDVQFHNTSSSSASHRRLCSTTVDFDTFIRMEQRNNQDLVDVHDFSDFYYDGGGFLFEEVYEKEELSNFFIDQPHSSDRRKSRTSKGTHVTAPVRAVADVSQKQHIAQTAKEPSPTVTANVATTQDRAFSLIPSQICITNELCLTSSNKKIPPSSPRAATGGGGGGGDSAAPTAAPRAQMSSDLSFPYRLLNLLNEAETYKFDDVVSWVQKGTAFLIHNEARFVAEILPLYFPNMKKMNSFRRQLSAYSFASMRFGPIAGAYYHQYFRRDDDDKILNIERKKTIKRSQRTASTTSVDVSNPKVQHVLPPVKPSACPTGISSTPGAVMSYPHNVTRSLESPQGQGQGEGQHVGYDNLNAKHDTILDWNSAQNHASPSLSNGAQHQAQSNSLFPAGMRSPFAPQGTWFEVQTHHHDPHHFASSSSSSSSSFRYPTASSGKIKTMELKRGGHGAVVVDDNNVNDDKSFEPVPFAPGFTWKRRQGQGHELEQQLYLHEEQIRHIRSKRKNVNTERR